MNGTKIGTEKTINGTLFKVVRFYGNSTQTFVQLDSVGEEQVQTINMRIEAFLEIEEEFKR